MSYKERTAVVLPSSNVTSSVVSLRIQPVAVMQFAVLREITRAICDHRCSEWQTRTFGAWNGKHEAR
jgi:hypothetical protein